ASVDPRRGGTADPYGSGGRLGGGDDDAPAPDDPDPWYGGRLTDFEETLETMERSVTGLTDHLRAVAAHPR
ncbi:low molecular weight phosphotyrosine protein phosphatase, partial [Burkholderia multivorans]